MRALSRLIKQKISSLAKLNKAALALTIFALLSINISCGKRKSPLPPIERVAQTVEISGFQRGNQVQLNWIMPARNAVDSNILHIERVDVYRLTESLNSSLTISETDFLSKSTLIATIPITANDFGLKPFTFTDSLEFAGQTARLHYAVRFVNSSGQKAVLSNFLLIEPTANIADAPKALAAKITEAEIKLKWLAPESNINGSKPVNVLGYNVYRSTSDKSAAKLINQTPVGSAEFNDRFFTFNTKYFYFVRSVSLGGNGNPVESLESNIINIFAEDTFPPAPPTALTVAAAPNALSIFFAGNTEKDIAGYKIFRSLNASVPLSEWMDLTPELLKTNTFQDTKVESGKTYYYYLIAVDDNGNKSNPSEIVSETAP